MTYLAGTVEAWAGENAYWRECVLARAGVLDSGYRPAHHLLVVTTLLAHPQQIPVRGLIEGLISLITTPRARFKRIHVTPPHYSYQHRLPDHLARCLGAFFHVANATDHPRHPLHALSQHPKAVNSSAKRQIYKRLRLFVFLLDR